MPFGPSPYLCTSTDIDVTPGTVKSNSGIGYLQSKYSVRKLMVINKKYAKTLSSLDLSLIPE